MNNYTKHNILSLFLSIMFSISLFFTFDQTANGYSTNEQSAQNTVKEFYSWYLNLLKKQIEPREKYKKTFNKYVSKTLSSKIEKWLNSSNYQYSFLKEPDFYGSLEADYFIKAQDFFDDWENNISVTPAEISNGIATTIVTLGATDRSRHTLRVNLKRELGLWKITAVFKIDPS